MCTYVCIYTFHLHVTHTHWFHVYMRTKYYAYTNTDQHSFICSFVWLYICLCAMHCFYMSIVVPVHIHLFCSMPVLIIVCTLHRCFHAYSHTHEDIVKVFSIMLHGCTYMSTYCLCISLHVCVLAYDYVHHRYQYGSTFERFCIYTHIYIFAIADVIILFCLSCVHKIHVCV